jgi:hypothetical protein
MVRLVRFFLTMKKHIFITLSSFFILTICYSQDLIVKTSGDAIRVKIIKDREKDYLFKFYNDQNDHIHKLSKRAILLIKYQHGEIDFLRDGEKIEVNPNINKDSLILVLIGEIHAFKNYRAYKPYIPLTIVTSIIGTPLLGLIPARSCSTKVPTDEHLNFPDKELMKNPVYQNAYIQKAMKMNEKKMSYSLRIGGLISIGFFYGLQFIIILGL